MIKKNILILIEAMIPFTNYWGGCQRAFTYGQKLVDSGYKVHVICRNQSNLDEGIVEYDNLVVSGRGEPIKPVSKTVDYQEGIKDRVFSQIKKNKYIRGIASGWFRFMFSEPNALDGKMSSDWVKRNTQYIETYIDENEIETVIISGPPFGLFYIVPNLKRKNVNVILDYRDPWTLWYEKMSLASLAEKRAVNNADLVITSTEALAEGIKSRFHANNVYPILNGYSKEIWDAIDVANRDNSRFVVSHIGTITINRDGGFRNATNFIKAANIFLSEHENAIVQFVGVKNPEEGQMLGLNSRLIFMPQVPVKTANEMIVNSSLLVALHTAHDSSGKYIICGKIYDYLKSGNQILSIGDCAFANKKIVEDNNAGIHCNDNTDSILSVLTEQYHMWEKHQCRSKVENYEFYSRDYQNTEFVRLVKDITK